MRICEPRTGDWVVVPTGQCPPCIPEGSPCESDTDCCAGHVCGPHDFGDFVGTACIPSCGVSDGCGTGCGSYILAGPVGIADPIYVDDDLRVSVNGVAVFDSVTGSPEYYVGPVGPFDASAGDTLIVEATNTFGDGQALCRVSLFCADGSAAQLVTEGSLGGGNNQDQPTTIPFLTASIIIDI